MQCFTEAGTRLLGSGLELEELLRRCPHPCAIAERQMRETLLTSLEPECDPCAAWGNRQTEKPIPISRKTGDLEHTPMGSWGPTVLMKSSYDIGFDTRGTIVNT